MIDEHGYRPNVGMIIINEDNQVFLGRRFGQKSWQFPQGGIQDKESEKAAMFRELHEETGLTPEDVEILGVTENWLKYDLPEQFQRKSKKPLCKGQRQKWFLLKLTTSEQSLNLDATDSPEFDAWRWVDYWYPAKKVIFFKRRVYEQALEELAKNLDTSSRAV